MTKPRVLIQLDPDAHASVFDAIVAIDSGIDHLIQYSGVRAAAIQSLVHGAIFTRGAADLKHTAIFVGGSDLACGEEIVSAIEKSFFGLMRVSVMLDSNGANSTAAAAVLCAWRHFTEGIPNGVVLGATGPVGQRVCRLLAARGSHVAVVSRDASRSEAYCLRLTEQGIDPARLRAVSSTDEAAFDEVLRNAEAIFGCGAAGTEMLSPSKLAVASQLKVAIDLNAVSPAGIPGIEVFDKATPRNGRVDYGAISVGGWKMKIHRAAIESLFSRNDLLLDAKEMFEIGERILGV